MCEIFFFLARNQSKQAHTEKPILCGPGGAASLLSGYLRAAQRPRCVPQAARPPGQGASRPTREGAAPSGERAGLSLSCVFHAGLQELTLARHAGRPPGKMPL